MHIQRLKFYFLIQFELKMTTRCCLQKSQATILRKKPSIYRDETHKKTVVLLKLTIVYTILAFFVRASPDVFYNLSCPSLRHSAVFLFANLITFLDYSCCQLVIRFFLYTAKYITGLSITNNCTAYEYNFILQILK